MPTDTQLLGWLERQNHQARYTGRCMFIASPGGWWSLYESCDPKASPSVRAAIAAAMDEEGLAMADAAVADEWRQRDPRLDSTIRPPAPSPSEPLSPAETMRAHLDTFGEKP